MSELKQVIETIEDECFSCADDYESKPETSSYGEGIRQGARLALKHIRGLTDQNRRADGWISVSERLPEIPEHDWVLVATKMLPEGWYGVPHIAELRNGIWYGTECEGALEETLSIVVTHWQPLPAAPKEDAK